MFTRSRFSLVLAVTLGVGVAQQSSAQTSPWSADGAIGGGTAEGGDYFDRSRTAARLAVGGRVLQQDKLAVFVEGGYDWLGFGEAPLVCALSSGGGCRPQFPNIAGPSVSAGLLFAPWRRVETRVGIGAGAYSVDGTLVGATLGQLDAAVFPATHVGVVLGTRFVVVPRYRGDRLTMIPVLIGVRLR